MNLNYSTQIEIIIDDIKLAHEQILVAKRYRFR